MASTDNYLQNFVETITRATTISKKTLTGGRAPVIVYHPNGTIREINASSSVIKYFYKKGHKLEFCPLHHFVYHIENKYKDDPTLPMIAGSYLECGLIGETAEGEVVLDMPRHKKTGAKLVTQQRIDTHIRLWDMRCQFHKISVVKEGKYKNVQVRKSVKWILNEYRDIDINMWVTLDLVSRFEDGDIIYPMAVQDIKYTGDLTSTWKDSSWGDIDNMDIIQAVLYSYVMDMPFVYLVHDGTDPPRFKPIPINVNINHDDPKMANEARNRIAEMKQTVKMFIDDLVLYTKHGWSVVPNETNCKKCKNIYCEFNGKTYEH